MKKLLKKIKWIFDYYILHHFYNPLNIDSYISYMKETWPEKFKTELQLEVPIVEQTVVEDIEPYFWQDKIAELPICVDLINNFKSIKDEVETFLKNSDILQEYPKYEVAGKNLYENYWKALPLSEFKGEYISDNFDEEQMRFLIELIKTSKQNLPTIQNVITDLECSGHLANVFISRLVPGSIINPHRGWTNDWMRIHLGIVCDSECKITVGEETKAWEEGKILAFKDGGTHLHSVKHEGSSERIILSMDVSIKYIESFFKN